MSKFQFLYNATKDRWYASDDDFLLVSSQKPTKATVWRKTELTSEDGKTVIVGDIGCEVELDLTEFA